MEKKKKTNEELSIDESFDLIEKKIEAMKSDDISLEEAFDRFKEGLDLLKLAQSKIDTIEKKVLLINSDGEVKDFE